MCMCVSQRMPTTQAISKWFGELDSETFSKHPRSPCYDIFRVSNDPTQGCTGVGRTGWHIDGTFRVTPYSHARMYGYAL